MLAGVTVVAPVALAVALVARTPPASAPDFPAPLRAAARARTARPPAAALSLFESALLWPGLRLRTRIFLQDDRRFLELAPDEALRSPDVLLYASDAPAAGDALPADARLLGRFGGSRPQTFALDVPRAASLWLFSLAHGRVLSRADLTVVPQ
jgi:hypothetical protein